MSLSRRMAPRWKSATFWERRCVILLASVGIILKTSSDVKTVRHVKMLNGVTILESKAQKDEYILEGNDVQNVSQSGVLPYGSYTFIKLIPS